MAKTKKVNALCKMCPTGCGVSVEVEDGKALKVGTNDKHPFNRLCPKSAFLLDVTYSDQRVAHPMRKVNDQWRKIAWEEAFDSIADRLEKIKAQDGAKTLAFHLGTPFIGTTGKMMARRFADLYGSPNFTSGSTLCYYSRTIGCSLTFDYGIVNPLPSFRGTKCMVVWGANPKESSFLQYGVIRMLRGKGGRLIVIDPRKTEMAQEADIHAQIRPGTDVVLAMSLIHVIVDEGLYDKVFVRDWTTGFDKLVERVEEYPPEKAEPLTWIPAAEIREIARTYANNTPSCILAGISPDHSSNGVQANRAIAIMMAITGNIDKQGGNMWARKPALTDLRLREKALPDEEGVGMEYPLFNRFSTEQTMMSVFDALLTEKPYPIKALFIQGSNPMLTFPDTNRTKEALMNSDLLVVIDLFMTDTAQLADIFLPASFALESEELKDYSELGIPLLAMGDKAIEPVGQSLPDWKIWSELGSKMGYQAYFPWKSSKELISYLLEPTGSSISKLQEEGGSIFLHPRPQRYLNEGFNTPSGKVEIYSETLRKHGYDPLPTYVEPLETPITPDINGKYPLILITGPRSMAFTHSQHRNIPRMLKRNPEPLAEINTKTANDLGIQEGSMVIVESPRGSIQMKARITDEIHTDVISIPHGWSDANANLLTARDSKLRDPISAYPPFRTGVCRVTPV